MLPGVAETLAELATRHRLILMTKGNHAEQADKLGRSGLASTFQPWRLSPKKIPPRIAKSFSAMSHARATSWMIGNSPKSDINPALAAGLNAVFLFHKDTWVLEHATLDSAPEGQQLIELDSFAKLCVIF